MNVGKKWVAAGSTATLLAGGLFLGAPAATAAPGDQACLAASTQFNAALGAAGIDLAFVNQLEVAVANVVTTLENALLLADAAASTEAAVAAQGQVEATAVLYDTAVDNVDAAQTAYNTALAAANGDVEAPAVVQAQGVLTLALADQAAALNNADLAFAAYEALVYTPEVQAAEAAAEAAAAEADALIAQLGGDEALAAQIVELFKAFLAACDASAIGVDPVVPIVTPVTPAPVVVTPAPEVVVVTPAPEVTVVTPAPVAVAPATGTNKGLNVQTAVATEDNSAAMTLIAALLAVGVAVPMATAARMRRLERAQR
ncbi:hypothetical protein AC792_07050 [Arthrobacter sp. RIT-PI-e]|uniref:hypothetical protein n=1 Tax=Arthrobacter sp. RIT-PI-e TaxID=1681197 RepID=UPI000675F073|nr:hypothetical protein [Arthrobacter sp. RIT-PI-e]KNC19329.1 hypothetical protein AC792_07050 [Arthrobacter sp. RIT-PI-e]